MSFAGRSVSNGSAAGGRGPTAKPPLAMSTTPYNGAAPPSTAAPPAYNRTPFFGNAPNSNPLELDIFSPARTPITNSNGLSRSALAMNPSLQQQQPQQHYNQYNSAAHARTSSMTAAVISPPHSPQPTDHDTATQVLPATLHTAATAKTISTTYKPATQAPSSAQLTSSASPIDDWTHVSPQSAPIASDPSSTVKASVKPNAWQTRQQQQSHAPPPPLPRQQSANSQRATSTPSTALAIIPQTQTQIAQQQQQHKHLFAESASNVSTTPPAPAPLPASSFDLSTFDVQLQRLVTTIDTRLQDSHESIRQDVAGLHVELIRQFHMHEQQTAVQLSSFMGEFRELLKECKALKEENRIWRERYG